MTPDEYRQALRSYKDKQLVQMRQLITRELHRRNMKKRRSAEQQSRETLCAVINDTYVEIVFNELTETYDARVPYTKTPSLESTSQSRVKNLAKRYFDPYSKNHILWQEVRSEETNRATASAV